MADVLKWPESTYYGAESSEDEEPAVAMEMRRVTWLMVLLATLLSAAGWVRAAVLNVPADYASIQDAVDAAADGDEIAIASGTYNEDVTINGKALMLTGAEPKPVMTSITATSSTLVLESLSVTGAVRVDNHADEIVVGGNLEFRYYADISGGASVTLENIRCTGLYLRNTTRISVSELWWAERYITDVSVLSVEDVGTAEIRNVGNEDWLQLRMESVGYAHIVGSHFEGDGDSCLYVQLICCPYWMYLYGSDAVQVSRSSRVRMEECSIVGYATNDFYWCQPPGEGARPCPIRATGGSVVQLLNTSVDGYASTACVETGSGIAVVPEDRPIGWMFY